MMVPARLMKAGSDVRKLRWLARRPKGVGCESRQRAVVLPLVVMKAWEATPGCAVMGARPKAHRDLVANRRPSHTALRICISQDQPWRKPAGPVVKRRALPTILER